MAEEGKDNDVATPVEIIKVDEFNIGEFRLEPAKEADKNLKKLQEIEESMKEVQALMGKLEQQKKEVMALENEIDRLVDEENNE